MPSKQISSQRCHRDIYWKLSTGGFTPSFTGQATEVSSSPFALTTAEFMYYATLDHVIGMRDRVTSAVIAGCKNCGCYFVIHSLQERKDNSTIREQREQGEQPRCLKRGHEGDFSRVCFKIRRFITCECSTCVDKTFMTTAGHRCKGDRVSRLPWHRNTL